MLGIAYKKNVDDVRESPSVLLMEKLRDLGAKVAYSDPHVPSFPEDARAFLRSVERRSRRRAVSRSFDCVLLATDHDKFDYEMICAQSPLVIDCRGKFLEPADNIVRA